MDIKTRVCFELSRRLMQTPHKRTVDYEVYDKWRDDSLSHSWNAFDDSRVTGKDVLDFGCGDGQLAFFLAKEKKPQRITGVDINATAIERARASLAEIDNSKRNIIDFLVGSKDSLPLPDKSFDTVTAFDCMEHVMSPGQILHDWYRVLRPGGRCLIEWFPYKGPWGPHMEALIPIPWAHVIFGEQAMFRTAELIYNLPEFLPRHWDLDEDGNKKPNKWCAWSSFKEQGYINQLAITEFQNLVHDAGFHIARFEKHSFSGSHIQQLIGRTAMRIPILGEYFLSFVIIELLRQE